MRAWKPVTDSDVTTEVPRILSCTGDELTQVVEAESVFTGGERCRCKNVPGGVQRCKVEGLIPFQRVGRIDAIVSASARARPTSETGLTDDLLMNALQNEPPRFVRGRSGPFLQLAMTLSGRWYYPRNGGHDAGTETRRSVNRGVSNLPQRLIGRPK